MFVARCASWAAAGVADLLGSGSYSSSHAGRPAQAVSGSNEWGLHAQRKRELYNALRVGHLAHKDMHPDMDAQPRTLLQSRSAKAAAAYISKDEQVAVAVELLT